MALTLTTATKDISVGNSTSEATLETWIDGLTVAHIYGFTCVALSNTTLRYTIVYD